MTLREAIWAAMIVVAAIPGAILWYENGWAIWNLGWPWLQWQFAIWPVAAVEGLVMMAFTAVAGLFLITSFLSRFAR